MLDLSYTNWKLSCTSWNLGSLFIKDMKKLWFEIKIYYRYITLMRFRDFFPFFILLFIISFPRPVEVRNVWLLFSEKKNDEPNVASLLPYICLQFDLTNLWLKWRELWLIFFFLADDISSRLSICHISAENFITYIRPF